MKLKLEVSQWPGDAETLAIPGLCLVCLDRAAISRILKLQKAVEELGLFKIEEFDYSPEWTQWAEDDEGNQVPGEPMRTERDCLVVTKDDVQWTAYIKYADVKLSTEPVLIADLAARLTD